MPPAQAEAEQRKTYFRPDIEGLRAIAVIAVVLFHVGLPGVTGGFVGVDVFYVISGFLITGLLLREGKTSGRVDLVGFYARRMRRLLPAALVVIVVTLVASAVILSPLRLTEVAGDAAASALYVANFRFALEATDYLAVGVPSPFLQFWSLGVEEQFYLFWPLLLLVAARLLTSRFLGVFVLILAVASFALSLYLTQVNQPWAFFMLPARAWELAAGALIAVGLVRVPRRAPGWVAGAMVWAGLALIVVSAIVISSETPFPGIAAVLPVLGAVLVIVGGMRATLPGRLLALAPMRYVGRISYSLYLWHWPILILIPIALGTDSLGLRIGLAFVAVLIAAVSTELIERPFRRGAFLNKRPRGSIKFGFVSSVTVALVALLVSGAIDVPNPFFKRDPAVVELAGVRNDLPQNYADGCHLSFIEEEPTDCAYGDRGSKKTAYLFGDSHAAQWLPALDIIAKEQGWRLEVQTKAACGVVPVQLWERKLRRLFDECHRWRQRVIDQIVEAEPEVVFVGMSRDYEIWNDGSVDRVVDSLPFWERQLTKLLKQLDERSGKVVLLAETPFLNFDPIDCLAQIREFGGCDPPRFLVVDARYAALEDAAVRAADVSVVSINDLLCPAANCPVVVDGAPVYRDRNHVTSTYMAKLAGPISEILAGRDPTASPPPG